MSQNTVREVSAAERPMRRRRRRPRKEGLGGTYDPAPLMALFHNADDHEVARRLGVSRSAVRFWRTGGRRISATAADEITIRLGLHPVLLWPEWGTTGSGPEGEP